MHGFLRIDPRIVHIHVHVVVAQFLHDVDDAGIAQIRAVFLKVRPITSTRALHMDAALVMALTSCDTT